MFVSLSSLLCHLAARSPQGHAVVLAALVCAACGSTSTPAGNSDAGVVTRTAQSALTQDAWQALLADDTLLKTTATAQAHPWQTAGQIVGADGATLAWAEFADADDAPRTAVTTVWRSCAKAEADAKPVCVVGSGQYTATGAQFTDAATGKELAQLPIAAPQAWEWETSTNLDSDHSTVVAALSGAAPPLDIPAILAQFGAILQQKRRFVVLSSYGPHLGVDILPIVDAAKQSGRFDSVETIEYVRRGDVEALLPTLTVLDTVVWIGAGVQQKPSKSSPPTKAIGMNVTRGVVGDEVYFGKAATTLLDTPPLGGPGLVVLAGQNTFLGDANDKQSLAAVLYEPGTRPIVGFSLPLGTPGVTGYAHIALGDVIHATAKLIGALGDGQNLDAAMQNAASGQAFTLTSPMAVDNRQKWTWTAPNGTFWAKQPSTGQLTIQLGLTPNCVYPVDTCDMASWKDGNKASGIINGSVSIVCANPAFVGPYFTCKGGVSQPPGTTFDITGVMRGVAAGDHILFIAQGGEGGPLGGALILGDGKLTGDGTDIGGGTTTYGFNGQANASFYTDANGNCCVTAAPLLVSTTSQVSQLQLHN
jgi:hypothetical protein